MEISNASGIARIARKLRVSPSPLSRIMGVQQRSGGIAHRLRSGDRFSKKDIEDHFERHVSKSLLCPFTESCKCINNLVRYC
jgi:hypothetical protein